jgi:hypothetical protein
MTVQMPSRAQIALHLCLVCLVTWAVSGLFATIGADPHHDAIMFKPALDVAHGKTLFRDTFTQYGALTTFIQAASIRIFGERLLTIRLVTAFVAGIYYVFFWLAWSQILKPGMATLAWFSSLLTAYFFADTFLPWSSDYALCFQAIGAYLFLRYVRNGSGRALFGAGASAALAFWCKQNVGPVMALSLAAALVILAMNRTKQDAPRRLCIKPALNSILIFSAGFVAACVPFLAWLAISGAFRDWFRQSIEFAYFFGRSGGFLPARLIVLRLIFAPLPWNILPIFCVGILAAGLRKLHDRVRLSLPEEMACTLSLLSLASLTQYFPVPDYAHFYWAGIPAIGVLFYGLVRLFRRRLTFAVVYLAVFAKVFSVSWAAAPLTLKEHTQISSSLGFLNGMRLNQQDSILYRSAKETIDAYRKAYPEMRMLNGTPDAIYLMFVPDYSFHPLYVIYWSTDRIYPDYSARLNEQIAFRKHMLLSWHPAPPGYTRVLTLDHTYTLYLYIPTDKLLDLQKPTS